MAQSSQTYLPAINMIFYVSISICEILLRKETHRGTVLLCQSVRQDVVPPQISRSLYWRLYPEETRGDGSPASTDLAWTPPFPLCQPGLVDLTIYGK